MPQAAVLDRLSGETPDPRIEGKRFIVNEFAVNQGWNAMEFTNRFNEFNHTKAAYRTVTNWINGSSKPQRKMLKLLCRFMREHGVDRTPVALEMEYDLAKDRKAR